MFHPEGARLVNQEALEHRGRRMGVFTAGGNLGFALGPLAATLAITALGLRGTGLLAVPGVVTALVLWRHLSGARSETAPKLPAGGRENWGAFGLLTAAVVGRSAVFYGVNTFVPLYWMRELHTSGIAGGAALTALLLCGAVGTVLGGRLADRWGRERVLAASLALVPFALLAWLAADHAPLASVLLAPLGVVLFAPSSVAVVLGQQYLPGRVGLASGVTLGLAISVGGLVAPLLGTLGDAYGLRAALTTLVMVSAVTALVAAGLWWSWSRPARPRST